MTVSPPSITAMSCSLAPRRITDALDACSREPRSEAGLSTAADHRTDETIAGPGVEDWVSSGPFSFRSNTLELPQRQDCGRKVRREHDPPEEMRECEATRPPAREA